ncbi:MAG: hypothetical protein HF977_15615 [ANME-2 cluster archaeon]|nr:hypothetical protein [ANME-2 cluster archaeon]
MNNLKLKGLHFFSMMLFPPPLRFVYPQDLKQNKFECNLILLAISTFICRSKFIRIRKVWLPHYRPDGLQWQGTVQMLGQQKGVRMDGSWQSFQY